ncbi:hypothetical protein GOV04_01845 [Candidatus Woesearchaeota archaeon]|nr:hypothetical protein [Candidatus Woesearchaeota archaeon]
MKLKNLLIITFLVLFAGCNGGDDNQITTYDVYVGSDGLILEMVDGAPPTEIFTDSLIEVVARLENGGAYNIVNGYLVLGLETDYFSFDNWQEGQSTGQTVRFALNGKTINNPQGDIEIFNARVQTRALDSQSEQHQSIMLLTACYDYKTIATPNVCIDTDPYDITESKKVCQAQDISLSSQGAPVAVTNIEVSMMPSDDEGLLKPHFIIEISNVGGGTVIDRLQIDSLCSASSNTNSDAKEFNVINLQASMSGRPLSCSPNNPIRLKDGSARVSCSFDYGIDSDQESFSTPLTVELDYGYTTTKTRTVTLLKG